MFGFLKKLFGGGIDLQEVIARDAVILDVRTPAEYRGGHVKGAVNIPLQQINQAIKKYKKQDKPVITCCASGRRSGMAANQLKAKGIEAYNGGSWTKVKRLLAK